MCLSVPTLLANSLRVLAVALWCYRVQPADGVYRKKDKELDRAALHLLRCEVQLGEGCRRRKPPQTQLASRPAPVLMQGACRRDAVLATLPPSSARTHTVSTLLSPLAHE
jgi:hypothetical protein